MNKLIRKSLIFLMLRIFASLNSGSECSEYDLNIINRIIIIIINRIFIQDVNHFSPKRTVINVSPVKYCT